MPGLRKMGHLPFVRVPQMLLAGKSLSPAIKQNPTQVRLQRVRQPTAGGGDRAGESIGVFPQEGPWGRPGLPALTDDGGHSGGRGSVYRGEEEGTCFVRK